MTKITLWYADEVKRRLNYYMELLGGLDESSKTYTFKAHYLNGKIDELRELMTLFECVEAEVNRMYDEQDIDKRVYAVEEKL